MNAEIWRIGLQVTVLCWCFWALAGTSRAQNGFVSIDCGYPGPKSYNTTNNIEWESDQKYIATGSNSAALWTATGSYPQRMLNLRYFDDARAKHCYTLPTQADTTYIVRASFLLANFSIISKEVSFDVTVNSTLLGTVTLSPDSNVEESIVKEGLFQSAGRQLFVCLVRRAGTPFLNSLELRPLAAIDMYEEVKDQNLLLVLQGERRRLGACCLDDRYPSDKSDRIWYYVPNLARDDFGDDYLDLFNASLTLTSNSSQLPPIKVMERASTDNTTFWIELPITETSETYYAALYFQELDPLVGSGRKFSISLDGGGHSVFEVNLSSKASVRTVFTKDLPQNGANLTLTKSATSEWGPILNAFELYSVFPFNSSSTDAGDVNVLDTLRRNFDLLNWTGDPCLPVSWNWLDCDQGSPGRVIGVFLGGTNLVGSIPDLRGLDKLQTLNLQNNSLSGMIPNTLAQLPNLRELFLDNNNLSGPLPKELQDLQKSSKSFNFTYSGNELLEVNCTLGMNCSQSAGSHSSSSNIGAVIGEIIGGIVVAAIVIGLFVCWLVRSKKGNIKAESAETPLAGLPSHVQVSTPKHAQQARAYSLKEIESITNNYKKQLGQGSFGPVYYGRLTDGREVAVKVNSVGSHQGISEFVNEVVLLWRVHHKNLVSLLGYCEEQKQHILIYAFIPNGTLSENLYGAKAAAAPLPWMTRVDIALNAARGLEYLHTGCNPPVIHRDVKGCNILLDEKLIAKVADFGISKSEHQTQTHTGMSTAVKGTPGYVDPEYFCGLKRLSQKSDVYSFGVVLLEIISGRRCFNFQSPDKLDDSSSLVQWMQTAMRDGNIHAIVDPSMREYNPESVWKVAELAMSCVELHGGMRPDMGQVVAGLDEAMQLQSAKTKGLVTGPNVQSQPNWRNPRNPRVPFYDLAEDFSIDFSATFTSEDARKAASISTGF